MATTNFHIYGTKDLEPAYTLISAAAGAQTEIVAASTGNKIRVLGYVATCETATGTFKFESASTAKTGVMTIADNGNIVSGYAPTGLFETASGEALNITTVSSAIEGHLIYTLVPA